MRQFTEIGVSLVFYKNGLGAIIEKDLSEFLSAGFIITRAVARPPYSSVDLLPELILSGSDCIAQFVPDTWCIDWANDKPESRLETAKFFGLDCPRAAEVSAWATPRFGIDFGWPNVIYNLETAVQLVGKFLPSLPDVKILELALHRTHVARFCEAAAPESQKPGFAPNGMQGVYEVVMKATPQVAGGRVLGFEPRVFDVVLSCSWLCNGLERTIAEKLNIQPNRFGLIETFVDACCAVQYISRADVGAEPGLWLPWLIIDHSNTKK